MLLRFVYRNVFLFEDLNVRCFHFHSCTYHYFITINTHFSVILCKPLFVLLFQLSKQRRFYSKMIDDTNIHKCKLQDGKNVGIHVCLTNIIHIFA